MTVIVKTSGTSMSTPDDWVQAGSTVDCIGSGGGGSNGSGQSGGGGGGHSQTTAPAFVGTLNMAIGAGGAGGAAAADIFNAGGAGAGTWIGPSPGSTTLATSLC